MPYLSRLFVRPGAYPGVNQVESYAGMITKARKPPAMLVIGLNEPGGVNSKTCRPRHRPQVRPNNREIDLLYQSTDPKMLDDRAPTAAFLSLQILHLFDIIVVEDPSRRLISLPTSNIYFVP